MAVTDPAMKLADAAVHVLGKEQGELKPRERADLVMLVDAACLAVNEYAPEAPLEIRKMASMRLVYFDWHTRLARQPGDGGMLGRPPRHVSLDPLIASGAAAILSRFKRRRATA